jgi:hypothetical protein
MTLHHIAARFRERMEEEGEINEDDGKYKLAE